MLGSAEIEVSCIEYNAPVDFSSDVALQIWQQLTPGEAVPAKDLTIELREGQGLLHLRLEYDPDTPLSNKNSRASLHSLSGGEKPPPISPSRFSLSRRRGADKDD